MCVICGFRTDYCAARLVFGLHLGRGAAVLLVGVHELPAKPGSVFVYGGAALGSWRGRGGVDESMEMAVTCGGGLVMHLFVALLLGSARGRGWPCGGAGRPAPPCRSLASPRQPDCRAVLCA